MGSPHSAAFSLFGTMWSLVLNEQQMLTLMCPHRHLPHEYGRVPENALLTSDHISVAPIAFP